MVQIWYTMIAGGTSTLIEANTGANSSKYVRSSRKILRRIVKQTLRRPDGMATLLSGSFAYNYMHGCDPGDKNADPDLDNLIFLCVTDALPFSSTPSQTRQAAYAFLTNIRRNFIEDFNNDIATLCGKNISDSISIDSKMSSNLKNSFDENTKSHLRRFAAQIKDLMFHEQQKEEKNKTGDDLNDGRYNISDTNDNPLNNSISNINNIDSDVPNVVIHNSSNLNGNIKTNTNNSYNTYNNNNNNNNNTRGGFHNTQNYDSYQKNTNSNNIRNNNNNNNNNNFDEKADDLRSRPPPAGHPIYRPQMGGKIDQVKAHLTEIQRTVNQSMDNLMERNESIGLLHDKSNALNDTAMGFNNRSRNLQRRYCRDLYKQRCIIAFVAVFVLYLLSAMICGWNWDSCSS